MKHSLRLHLVLWLIPPLMCLLALDAFMTYRRAMGAANVAFDRTLFSSAKAIAEGLRIHGGEVVVDIPYLALEIFESNAEGRIYYKVSEDNGRYLTGYQDLPPAPRRDLRFYRPVYYEADYQDVSLRLIALRQPVHDVATGVTRVVWVQVGETPELRRELAKEILIGALQQEALLVALAVLIVLIATYRGLAPLRQLSEQVAARAEGDLSPVAVTRLPSELRPLTDALNQYVARMSRMLSARRRFFVDAAHQLKTPLAILRAQTQTALRERDPSDIRRGLLGMEETLGHASRGVQQLLSLARLETDSGYEVALEPLDLAALVREVALEWAAPALAAGVTLGYEGPRRAMVLGRRELLQELVSNLIDNALLYSGSDDVLLVLSQDETDVTLAVIDHGHGVAVSESEKLFKRFYRGDSAKGEGSGLGLAIVREIAHRHAGAAGLQATPGGGLTVLLRLPAQAARGEAAGPPTDQNG
ncbi:sensor histidine kinase [Chitiniphilus shinanonensis]|uniref:histidine kinase n=1 Tax=Chitiniphilus shinanonensis TaxID=553088 RepID=A0ABQ6BP38_9NEIS|nr:sensor histidine kinase [Chitiniphilus shinanonensis]GLS03046.1 sensor histidine kinase [Chitiniphilus shinanonensis]